MSILYQKQREESMDTIIEELSKQHSPGTIVSVGPILSANDPRRVIDKICHQLECARQDIRNKHYDAADAAIVHAVSTLLVGEVG